MFICFRLIVSRKNLVYASTLSANLEHVLLWKHFPSRGYWIPPPTPWTADQQNAQPPPALTRRVQHISFCALAVTRVVFFKVRNKLSVTTKLSRAPSLPPMGNRHISLSQRHYHFSSIFHRNQIKMNAVNFCSLGFFLDNALLFILKSSPSGFPDILACLCGEVATQPEDESCCCEHVRAAFCDKYCKS